MIVSLYLCLASAGLAWDGDAADREAPRKELETLELAQGDVAALLAPEAGANLFSIRFRGREILRQPEKIEDLPGFLYGTPILYPTPNRVADAQFTFEGRRYRFEPNNGSNFLHGLVHSAPFGWRRSAPDERRGSDQVVCELDFSKGKPWFELFPHRHVLRVTIDVFPDAVRWTYTVDNSKGDRPVPYGFAIHPWFLYQGERGRTRLTVPATHWMEAVDLLPTGKLVPLEGTDFDARRGRSLEGFVIDDVYFGMTPDRPTRIDFQDAGLSLELAASEEFTHLVVYTPLEPHFCVENQTCSTDAHNLYARGLEEESHLQIVPPGQSQSGWVQLTIRPAP